MFKESVFAPPHPHPLPSGRGNFYAKRLRRNYAHASLILKQSKKIEVKRNRNANQTLAVTGSSLAGPVDQLLDYPQIFLAIAGLQIAMAVGLRLVNPHSHYSALATLEERRLTTVAEKRSV